jgi:hypothetical protein
MMTNPVSTLIDWHHTQPVPNHSSNDDRLKELYQKAYLLDKFYLRQMLKVQVQFTTVVPNYVDVIGYVPKGKDQLNVYSGRYTILRKRLDASTLQVNQAVEIDLQVPYDDEERAGYHSAHYVDAIAFDFDKHHTSVEFKFQVFKKCGIVAQKAFHMQDDIEQLHLAF